MGNKRNKSDASAEPTYEALLPAVVTEVTQEWADSKALGLPMMYAEGQSWAEVCRDLGVSKDQYKEACKLSESFAAADKYSQVVHEAWWNKTGRKGAEGKRINGSVWNHTMNNRYGWANNGNDGDDASKGRTLNIGIVFMGNKDAVQTANDLNSVIDMTKRLTVIKNDSADAI